MFKITESPHVFLTALINESISLNISCVVLLLPIVPVATTNTEEIVNVKTL